MSEQQQLLAWASANLPEGTFIDDGGIEGFRVKEKICRAGDWIYATPDCVVFQYGGISAVVGLMMFHKFKVMLDFAERLEQKRSEIFWPY